MVIMRHFEIFGKKVFSWGEEESKVHKTVHQSVIASRQSEALKGAKPTMLRKIALREPLILKAIHKKNKDTFRNWFKIKPTEGTGNIDKNILRLIKDFDKRTNFPYKLYTSGVCANIYGTGFLERTFIESKNKENDSPVDFNNKPLNLFNLNSEFITRRKKKEKGKDNISYFIYKEKRGEEVFIHPDRIIDIAIDKLPYSSFGISKIDVLINVLQSKMDADVTSGEILSWFGHGILDMTIENMQPEQEKEMIKLFKQHPNYYAHDQDYKLNVVNPNRIDPKPFYDYFYTNIAAALEMPVHILTGESLGNVTGSEIGVSDYYHDIENIQKIIFTPIIRKIYTQLLESNGHKWKYDIVWNPIFVDELSEAKILQTRSYPAVQGVVNGILSIPEGRRIYNDGVVDLDIEKVPEKSKPEVEPPKDVSEPNVEPQPTVKKPTVKQKVIPLTEEQKIMIKRAGIRETIEQEKRLKEAEEKTYAKSKNERNN